MVPARGVEPLRPCGHWVLSPDRLPVPTRRHATQHTRGPRRSELVRREEGLIGGEPGEDASRRATDSGGRRPPPDPVDGWTWARGGSRALARPAPGLRVRPLLRLNSLP